MKELASPTERHAGVVYQDRSIMNASHMRVCFLVKRMDVGGAETRTLELANAIPEVDFTFVTTSMKPGVLDADVIAGGHRLVPVGLSVLGVARFWSLLARGRFSAVHSQMGISSGLHLAVAFFCRVPVRVAHFRSDGIGGSRSLRRAVALLLSRFLILIFATQVVGVSPGSLSYGWRRRWASDRRCMIIPNFIDVERTVRPSGEYPTELVGKASGITKVAHIGRSEPSKRQELAIRVWAESASLDSSSRFHIVGSLSDNALQELDALPGSIRSRVRHFEYVPKAGGALRFMDLTLVTSDREGLPGVVLESLAVGTPVVGSDIPGIRWIAGLVEGVFLVPVDATIHEWIRSLDSALATDRDHLRESFSKSVFTPGVVTERFCRLWAGDL